MIYELRIYECVPGRLPDLNNRFSTITLKIWERHGIQQAGFWTTIIGESNQTLYYMLKFDSLADREAKWNAFQADPRVARRPRQDGSQRPDRCECQEFYSRPDALFGREVIG